MDGGDRYSVSERFMLRGLDHALGCLSQCVYMTRSVLLQASESLNQCMWNDVLRLLRLNYMFIDFPLTLDLGRIF